MAISTNTGMAKMTKFIETDEGEAFIASGPSRETSKELMRAIAFFARNAEEAETIWVAGDVPGVVSVRDIWEHVTCNGLHDAKDFCWGASGENWYDAEEAA